MGVECVRSVRMSISILVSGAGEMGRRKRVFKGVKRVAGSVTGWSLVKCVNIIVVISLIIKLP